MWTNIYAFKKFLTNFCHFPTSSPPLIGRNKLGKQWLNYFLKNEYVSHLQERLKWFLGHWCLRRNLCKIPVTMLPSLIVTNMISVPEMSKKMCHGCGTAHPVQFGHETGQRTVTLVYKGHVQEWWRRDRTKVVLCWNILGNPVYFRTWNHSGG